MPSESYNSYRENGQGLKKALEIHGAAFGDILLAPNRFHLFHGDTGLLGPEEYKEPCRVYLIDVCQ